VFLYKQSHFISTGGEIHCIKEFSFFSYHQIIKGTEIKPEKRFTETEISQLKV